MIRWIAVWIVIGVIACGRDARPDVALLLSTRQEQRYDKDVRYFEQAARRLGLRPVTLVADDDGAKQLAQVEDVLARGAKVLVVQPTESRAAARYVRLAHEYGAKLVAYDRAIVSPDVDYFVAHDSYRVGVLEAEAALKATGGKGKYVLLAGQAGQSVTAEITRGYENTLAPYVARGDVEIVVKQNHPGWSQDEARRTVADAIARGPVDAILANNSSLARGAVEAVTVAGLGNVFIAGADADAANVNYVCQGKQSIEIFKDIQPLAEAAASVAKRFVDGTAATAAETPVELVRVSVVTPDTVKPLLVDSGFLSVDELPACKTKLAVRR